MIKSIKRVGTTVAAIMIAGSAHAAECGADDVATGKKAFRACLACHKIEDGKNGVGPHLFGLIGRPIANVEGFKYSKPMKAYAEANGAWTVELFDVYIANPRKVVKGTRMAYPGLKKEKQRKALICYLENSSG